MNGALHLPLLELRHWKVIPWILAGLAFGDHVLCTIIAVGYHDTLLRPVLILVLRIGGL